MLQNQSFDSTKKKINQDKIAFWGYNHDYSKAIIIHITDLEVAPQNMTYLVIESDFSIILLKDVDSLSQIQLHFKKSKEM